MKDFDKQMEMVLYHSDEGDVSVDAYIIDDSLWITQKAMAELFERVRSIRASERRIWQQITDIFAECSIDYTKDSEVAYHFYATIQNRFHYAITMRHFQMI